MFCVDIYVLKINMFKVILIIILICSIACGPHSHKIKAENKEKVEDGGPFTPRDSNHYKDGNHNSEFDHESVLGSRNTVHEYSTMSPAKAKKRLERIALEMDKNGDQYVDKKEMMDHILFSFKMLTEEEAEEELEDEDADEDGKITWEEHLAEVYGVYDDNLVSQKDKEGLEDLEMMQNDRELFQAADLNDDGILNKSEYPAFSHSEEFEHMHEVLYVQAMRKRDLDKDGFLSFAEYIAEPHASPPAEDTVRYVTEKDQFVNDYDLNHDGKLSKEEVLLWLIPNNTETAQSEAEHLIEIADTNKDGKLSIEEVVDHHEVFVGSEVDHERDDEKPYKWVDEL